MKKYLIISFFILCRMHGIAQTSSSVIQTENYFNNPVLYLSQINTENISSGILIDRTIHDSLILNLNGFDKVTTISASQWARLYSYIDYSSFDTSMTSLSKLGDVLAEEEKNENSYIIGLLDFNFQKIRAEAMINGDFIETEEYLIDNGSGQHSYENHKLITASVLALSTYGENLNFLISDKFIYTNNDSSVIEKIEIRFNNWDDEFLQVYINEPFNVSFGAKSEFLKIVLRISYRNLFTDSQEVLYAHCTVLRKGPEAVPLPDISTLEELSTRSSVIQDHGRYNFPNIGPKIEYFLLYSDQNPAKGKLRRPIVISDAFDPGNKRDYYETYFTPDEWKDMEKTPKDQDKRGMFEILNGDPSPWYQGIYTSPNLLTQLRQDGYDLVFVNYLDGAGDIYSNATVLRNFFNQVLNGWMRDNKTEEIILLGPSMGGIITRLMMTQMEQAGENHYVRTWISYDSPQAGANIPLSLQHAIKFLTQINTGGIQLLKDAKAAFEKALGKVDTPAAKQMLLYHYSATNGKGLPASQFNALYTDLAQKGYPKYSKNYAVTNGGNGKLLSNEGLKIVDLKFKWAEYTWVEGFSHRNVDGLYKIFEGSRQGAGNDELLYTNTHLGMDNAPGGWNASIYTLNYADGNKNKKTNDSNIQYTRTTFMPTATAFGVTVNRNTVYKTHGEFTHCNDNNPGTKIKTAFDEIYGIDGINEEHVTVSPPTSSFLFEELRKDFSYTIRPRERSGQTLNQVVNGPVAYTVKDVIEFGRKNSSNTIVFENQANVIISAGQKIVLLPGFSTKAGAKMVAKIENINHGTVLLSPGAPNINDPSNLEFSPYIFSQYDYSDDIQTINIKYIEEQREAFKELKMSIYPNPAGNFINIAVDGIQENAELEIWNSLGQLIYNEKINKNGVFRIDTSFKSSGLFYIKFIHSNKIIYHKFIKL